MNRSGSLSPSSVVGLFLGAWFLGALISSAHVLATKDLRGIETGFFGGFIVLGILLIALYFVSLKVKPTIYLLIVSVFLPLYAYEAYVRISSSDTKPSKGSDRRSKYQVVMEMRSAGTQAYPAVFPIHFTRKPLEIEGEKIIPLGGVPSATTVLCREAGPYVVYDSDKFGFNNPAAVWNEPIQIALLGDSYTQGECVAPEKHFAGILRAQFPGTLNLGMAGNGPLAELAGIREYLSHVKPRTVLWFYYEGNDLIRYRIKDPAKRSDIFRESKAGRLNQYVEPNFKQNLLGKQDTIREAMLAFIERRLQKKIRQEREC